MRGKGGVAFVRGDYVANCINFLHFPATDLPRPPALQILTC